MDEKQFIPEKIVDEPQPERKSTPEELAIKSEKIERRIAI
jgi:hypothetical protein